MRVAGMELIGPSSILGFHSEDSLPSARVAVDGVLVELIMIARKGLEKTFTKR